MNFQKEIKPFLDAGYAKVNGNLYEPQVKYHKIEDVEYDSVLGPIFESTTGGKYAICDCEPITEKEYLMESLK